MIYSEDDNFASFFIESVEHAVGAAAGRPDAAEFPAQRFADPAWLRDQVRRQEVDDRRCDSFRQLVGQRPSRWRSEDEFVVVLLDHRRSWRTASTPRTTSPRPYAASASRMSPRASGSLSTAMVSSS